MEGNSSPIHSFLSLMIKSALVFRAFLLPKPWKRSWVNACYLIFRVLTFIGFNSLHTNIKPHLYSPQLRIIKSCRQVWKLNKAVQETPFFIFLSGRVLYFVSWVLISRLFRALFSIIFLTIFSFIDQDDQLRVLLFRLSIFFQPLHF